MAHPLYDITERTGEGFAESSLVLFQVNGLRIEDNAVTRSNDKYNVNIYLYIYIYIKQNQTCISCAKKPLKLLVYWVVVKNCS